MPVAVCLQIDVSLVAQRCCPRYLSGPGDDKTLVAPSLSQVPGQVRVTGVEADPEPGQVGALGQRMDSQHAFGPML